MVVYKIIKQLCSFMLILFLGSCSIVFKYGNGEVVKKEYSVSNINSIKVSSGFNVFLRQSDTSKIIVETDENLHDYVNINTYNSAIEVNTSLRVKKASKKNLYIQTKEICNFSLSGGGNLICQSKLQSKNIKFTISGSGNASINTEADSSIINFSGGGNLNAKLKTKELNFIISGGSQASLSGFAKNANFNVKGGRDTNCQDIKITNLILNLSGGSNAIFDVTNSITGEINGGGDLTLKSKPNKQDLTSLGGSKIKFNN